MVAPASPSKFEILIAGLLVGGLVAAATGGYYLLRNPEELPPAPTPPQAPPAPDRKELESAWARRPETRGELPEAAQGNAYLELYWQKGYAIEPAEGGGWHVVATKESGRAQAAGLLGHQVELSSRVGLGEGLRGRVIREGEGVDEGKLLVDLGDGHRVWAYGHELDNLDPPPPAPAAAPAGPAPPPPTAIGRAVSVLFAAHPEHLDYAQEWARNQAVKRWAFDLSAEFPREKLSEYTSPVDLADEIRGRTGVSGDGYNEAIAAHLMHNAGLA